MPQIPIAKREWSASIESTVGIVLERHESPATCPLRDTLAIEGTIFTFALALSASDVLDALWCSLSVGDA